MAIPTTLPIAIINYLEWNLDSTIAAVATVQIVIWWRLPEEKTQGVDPHSYTVLASVYANPP